MKFKRKSRQAIDVNMMPLIDVIFLLLIFFMVSTTFTKDSRLGVNLPQSKIGESVLEGLKVEVVIDASGRYKITDFDLESNDASALKSALSKLIDDKFQDQPEAVKPSLTITADANAAHQYVITVMDIAGQLGFSKLSITTLKQE